LRLLDRSIPRPGQIIPEVSFTLDNENREGYCEGSVCISATAANKTPVSPTVAAGICIAKLSRQANLPAGSIHTHASFEHCGRLFAGETVYCSGRISSVITRGSFTLLTMIFKISNTQRQPVVHGRISLLLKPKEFSRNENQ